MQKFTKMVVVLVLCWGLGGLSGLGAMAAVDGQININTAGGQELEKLPFIGEARAQLLELIPKEMILPGIEEIGP